MSTAVLHLGLVVCVAKNGVIGRDGGLPWHEPEDLKHFRAVTMGHPIVMGWTTHQSIGKALPGRRNLVLTASRRPVAAGCESFASFEDAIDAARTTDDCPMVIGGAGVYTRALPDTTHLYLTELQEAVEGDTYFPDLDPSDWIETDRRVSDNDRLVFRTLRRDS